MEKVEVLRTSFPHNPDVFLYICNSMGRLKKEEYITRFGEEAWAIESKKRSQKAMDWAKRNMARHNKASKKWRDKAQYDKQRYQDNKEKELERSRNYYKTIPGRAHNLIKLYRTQDKKKDRGDCTLTRDWIVDHIFSSFCVYCGDSDWTHLGCDRIDNSLPHTPENCVCSCGICNVDRQLNRMSVEEFVEYRKTHYRECDKQQRAAPN